MCHISQGVQVELWKIWMTLVFKTKKKQGKWSKFETLKKDYTVILNPVHIRFNLESNKNIASKAPTLVTLTEPNPLERVQHCNFPGPFSWVSHAAWLGLHTENHCGKWGPWTSDSSLDSPCYSNFMSLIQRGKMFWNTSLVLWSSLLLIIPPPLLQPREGEGGHSQDLWFVTLGGL